MGIRPIAALVLSLGLGVSLALPARGQVTSVVDDHGRRVFINANPPASRHNRSSLASQAARQARLQVPSGPSQASNDVLDRIVREAADRHRVDPRLVRAVVEAESGWNPVAISRKGALGLMQLVPTTAERFGAGNVFDPQQNVEAGVRYLRTLLERYQGDLTKSLAAYNAGEDAVDRAGGVPNYPETRAYIRKVTDSYFRLDSGPGPHAGFGPRPRPIYRSVDERGRVVFTNE